MNESNPIRVLVVDDHAMVRRGLATFLKIKPDLELVSEASNGEDALCMCEQFQPDVVLMDLLMPKMNGTEATRAIRERWPHIQVIALTSFQERNLVEEALQAGAISYLLKNVSVDDLSEAIRGAYAGRSTLAPEAMKASVRSSTMLRAKDPATPTFLAPAPAMASALKV